VPWRREPRHPPRVNLDDEAAVPWRREPRHPPRVNLDDEAAVPCVQNGLPTTTPTATRQLVSETPPSRLVTHVNEAPENVSILGVILPKKCYLVFTFTEGSMVRTIERQRVAATRNRAARRNKLASACSPSPVFPCPLLRTHGGRSQGAGRPPAKKRNVPHRARPVLCARHPVHVTMSARGKSPILTEPGAFRGLVGAIRALRGREGFRIVHFRVQDHHIYLICEAESQKHLSQGMQSLALRMTYAFNRVFARKGSLWASRYHARSLRTPREVRQVIVYVLGNRRHHGGQYEPKGTVDPCSSAPWFTGFREQLPPAPQGFVPPTSEPQTWLLSIGWKRHSLISVDEGAWPR
jgi:putative transposase